MPVDKVRAAGFSSSALLDLNASIAKQKEELEKNKAAGKASVVRGGSKRAGKKADTWKDFNAGTSARAARDLVDPEEIKSKNGKANLIRKTGLYDQLSVGKDAGLSDKARSELLVNFDEKDHYYDSGSDDVDESLTVPRPPDGQTDDPMVEYKDEFGRTRIGRRSEVPQDEILQEEEDPNVIYNPIGFFPVYERTAEEREEIAKTLEEDNPLEVHYDSSRENRAKGAAHYTFSADMETRLKQQEALNISRQETQSTRQERGARDVKPGEIEGMRVEGSEGFPARSRAMENWKQKRDERKSLVNAAKRRKVEGKEGFTENAAWSPGNAKNTATPSAVVDPFAAVEAQKHGPLVNAEAWLSENLSSVVGARPCEA